MYCQKCGDQNPDGSTRCFSCGVELASSVAQVADARTSGLAVAALILGIMALFTCGITALPAIVCGIIALVKISGSRGLLKGTGMAVAGIVLSAMLAMVVPPVLAILMPALSKVKHVAQRVVCGANLQGLSTAMIVYSDSYDGKLPTANQWCDLLMQQADVSEQSFQCPGAPQGACTYAININLMRLEDTTNPQMVAIFESRPGWNQVGGRELLTTEYHRGEGCNVAFADGSVMFIRAEDLDTLQWTADR